MEREGQNRFVARKIGTSWFGRAEWRCRQSLQLTYPMRQSHQELLDCTQSKARNFQMELEAAKTMEARNTAVCLQEPAVIWGGRGDHSA